MYDIMEIEAGSSYACKFRLTTVLDELNRPYTPNSTHQPVGVGEYESVGVIVKRDVDAKIVELLDTRHGLHKHYVSFDNLWDVDSVEWINPVED